MSKKTKILFVTRNFSRAWGGFEEHVFRLFTMVRKYDFETRIITTDIIEHPKISGMKVLKSLGLFGYCYTPELSKFIIKEDPDIIHIHGWGSYVIERSITLGRYLEIPVILTPHEFFHRENIIKRLYTSINKRTLLKIPDIVIALTEHQKMEIKNYVRKSIVIPNGINVEEFKNMRFRNLEYVISVGRLEKYKGFDLILEVCKELNKKVVIVGRKTKYYWELIRKIKKDNINAEIYPDANRKALLRLLEGASLYICASKKEGFGISIIEALASGLPIISTPVGIAPELPNDFVRIFKSKTELYEMIKEMGNKKKKIFQKARQYAFQNFSWDNIIKKYIDVYRHLIR